MVNNSQTPEFVQAMCRTVEKLHDTLLKAESYPCGSNNDFSRFAANSLHKIYKLTKDPDVKSAIESIPRKIYGKHIDAGDHGRSCHTDEGAVIWDLNY